MRDMLAPTWRRWAAAAILQAALVGALAADELLVGPGRQFQSIDAAIDAAQDGDIVRVDPGSYKEAIDFQKKKITVSATSPDAALTIIDAIDFPQTSAVSFKSGEAADSVLEGFTITGGSGTPLTPATRLGGGGIFINQSAPTIRRCVIRTNTAVRGGGVLVQGAGAGGLFESCEITENTSREPILGSGGGIAVTFSGAPAVTLTFRDCRITKNVANVAGAARGGGAYLGGTSPGSKVVFENCVFEENRVGAPTTSGGDGGGLYVESIGVELKGCVFSKNQALKGGGIALLNLQLISSIADTVVRENVSLLSGGGGGIWFPASNSTRITLTNVEVSNNSAGSAGGGGMWVESGTPSMESCKFVSNRTTQDGGAIRFVPPNAGANKVRINATLFRDNQAGEQGGAVYVSGSAAGPVIYSNCVFVGNRSTTGSGGIESGTTNAAAIQKVFYCTFVGNQGPAGTGGALQFVANSQGVIMNSILWDNLPADLVAADGPKISNSDIKAPPFPRPGMLSVDPQFVSPTADPPDFRLKDTSPLIDKGTIIADPDFQLVAKDGDGKERVADGNQDTVVAPDMGAYEIVLGPVLKPKFVRGFCRHPDAQLDGARLHIGDPIYLLRYKFGGLYPEPGCLKGCDANDNGTVDVTDAIFLLQYLFLGSRVPPRAPFPALGEDGTIDTLTCVKGKLE